MNANAPDMLNSIVPDPQGTFTIREALLFTDAYYPDRFARRIPEKERMRAIRMQKVVRYEVASPGAVGAAGRPVPKTYYRLTTYLRPKYQRLHIGGNIRLLGRHIPNSYEITFETDELTLSTRRWRIRLGSNHLWQQAPQHALASLPKHERENNVDLQEWLRTRSARQALFMNNSDWNSLVLGINADFLFRCAYVYKRFGHLWGSLSGPASFQAPTKTNPSGMFFLPKHIINFFETLMEMGVLKKGGA